MSKKEDNPFSFKHFLKKDSSSSQSNYQHTGARPKIYTSGRLNTSSNNLDCDVDTEGVYTRNPTELPDFVQDHLVIEQCYLNNDVASNSPQIIPDVDNLPDFTLNNFENVPLRNRNSVDFDSGLTFDLTDWKLDGTCKTPNSDKFRKNSLSRFDHSNENSSKSKLLETINFPLDLPVPPPIDSNCDNQNDNRNHSPETNSNIPKSLPDFLSDGPIRNRFIGPQLETNNSINLSEPIEQRLQFEIELLRQDLEKSKRDNNEKKRRIQLLEAELASRKAVDHEETAHLEKAMEQVEDNLKRSTRRAVNAENTVTALKHEIKVLTVELSELRAENRELRTSAGIGSKNIKSLKTDKINRLAGDIKDAASSADSLLRQLMSGVDNLKIIASTLENVDRIEDRTKDFLQDFEDNAAGPAI